MSFNPYTALGLDPTATPAEIKAAFRRKSTKGPFRHPDRGGDEAAFALLLKSYELLKDPVKRARYDATGETEMVNETLADANAIATAASYFLEAVGAVQPHVFVRDDAIARAIATSDAHLREHQAQQVHLSEFKKRLTSALRRLKHASEATASPLHQVLEDQLASVDRSEKGLALAIEQQHRVRKHLEAYTYEVPPSYPAGGGGTWITLSQLT